MMLMGNTNTWIAVVDDEEGIRRALLRLLRSAGLEAHAFTSGKLFVESLSVRQPACVVLDLYMPDMNGFEVLSTLSHKLPELPVIVMTGHDITAPMLQTSLAHATEVLQKPMNDQALLNAIARGGQSESK
jgi:FixJ family two-component response regulator